MFLNEGGLRTLFLQALCRGVLVVLNHPPPPPRITGCNIFRRRAYSCRQFLGAFRF